MIPASEWRWFGTAVHFLAGEACRFHMATVIGDYVVSTVGAYLPDSKVWEIYAESRGLKLEGQGDYRKADWMKKVGYEDIGDGRKYETMVFRLDGYCDAPDCRCGGGPRIDPSELDFSSYNDALAARLGHMAMCEKWATVLAAEAQP